MSQLSDRAAKIRSAVSLEDYLRDQRKLNMRPEGSTLKAVCPFHPDKTPSLQVDPKPGTRWYCHGCGAGGDVISWVIRADGVGFIEALDQLSTFAGLTPIGISTEERAQYEARVRHHRVLDKVNRAFIEWSIKQAGKHITEFKEFVEGKRGLTLDLARRYKIGYVDASETTVRAALLDAGLSIAEIDESMILHNPALFRRRVVIGVKNHDQIRQIYGRSVDDADEPHHLYQTGTEKTLFNLDRTDKGNRLIVCESIFDTLALVQMGYEHEAVGTLGASVTDGQVRDLQRGNKKVWILFDNDRTGLEKSIDLGLRLGETSHAITRLKGRIKDPNDYLKTGGSKLELDKLLEESKSDAALPIMIGSIDPTTPRHELPKALEPVLQELAKLEEMTAKAILDEHLRKQFKMSAGEIGQYKSRVTKLRTRRERQLEIERKMERSENPDLPEVDIDLKELHNGVSYVDGDLWFQFLIQKPQQVYDKKTHAEKLIKETQVWYVSSSRQFRRRDAIKVDDEIVVDMTPVGIRPGRWSLSGKTPNSIEAWRQKSEDVDPIIVYDEIRKLMKQYLWFPDERYYDVLSCWVMMTYWLPIFDTVGYLFLHASKRSGKTVTLTLLGHLAYEAELMGDVSGSALFRKIEGSRGSMLLDEMEKLASEEFARSGDPVNQVLLTGYKSSGNTQRTDLDLKSETNSGAVTFSTYCAKVIANTMGIKVETIRDRSIELTLLRSDHKMPQFNERKHQKAGTFQELRNKLYTLALKYTPEISEIYEDRFEMTWDSEIEKLGLFGRDYEVWIALWTVAMFLEEKGKKGLLANMIQLAHEHKGHRDSSIAEDSIDAPLLKALRRFVREHRGTVQEASYKGEKEWYPKEAVMNYLKRYPRLRKMKDSTILAILQRLYVVGQNPPTTSIGGHSVSIIKVSQAKVMEAIKRYDIGDDDPLMEDESLEDLSLSEDDASKLAGHFS